MIRTAVDVSEIKLLFECIVGHLLPSHTADESRQTDHRSPSSLMLFPPVHQFQQLEQHDAESSGCQTYEQIKRMKSGDTEKIS